MSRRFTYEALMSSKDPTPTSNATSGAPQADAFMMLPAAHLPVMQALAMQCLYQLAFEQAQSDARAAHGLARLEPSVN